jgi:hypothetical protein
MSGFSYRRALLVFAAFIILGPSLAYAASALTDSKLSQLGAAAIGGGLGAFAGLAIETYLSRRGK